MRVTYEDELAMLSNPGCWPCWPYLPLKRPGRNDGTFPEFGLLTDSKENRFTVYITNICEVDIEGSLSAATQYTYHSFHELLAAGWVVD